MTGASNLDAGFTLIEALVAMAVLAVAGVGLVCATQGHVDTVAAIEARVAGGLAADNALAEARLGLTPAAGTLLGRDWHAGVAARASDDPAVAALTVTAASGGTRVTLRGFRDSAPAAADAPPSAGIGDAARATVADASPAAGDAPAVAGAPR